MDCGRLYSIVQNEQQIKVLKRALTAASETYLKAGTEFGEILDDVKRQLERQDGDNYWLILDNNELAVLLGALTATSKILFESAEDPFDALTYSTSLNYVIGQLVDEAKRCDDDDLNEMCDDILEALRK